MEYMCAVLVTYGTNTLCTFLQRIELRHKRVTLLKIHHLLGATTSSISRTKKYDIDEEKTFIDKY